MSTRTHKRPLRERVALAIIFVLVLTAIVGDLTKGALRRMHIADQPVHHQPENK